MTEKSEVFDSALLIRHDLGQMPQVNEAFINHPRSRAHLAGQLLLYDRVILPTHDYGIVAALINWLGPKIFEEALDDEVFVFVKHHGLLCYAGNGNAICSYTISTGDSGREFTWWQEALFGDSERGVAEQIRHFCPLVDPAYLPKLAHRIVAASQTTSYGNDIFMRHVAHETYREVQDSALLQKMILSSLPVTSAPIDLTRLPGISPNQMRAGLLETGQDAIDVVLQIAEVHRDLLVASTWSQADLYVPKGTDRLLQSKLARVHGGQATSDAFKGLLDLNDVPDVEAAIESGSLHPVDVWQLRQTADAQGFRSWLRHAHPSDARDLERMFVSTLGPASWIDSVPRRILRFALARATGSLGALPRVAARVVGSFFADKW